MKPWQITLFIFLTIILLGVISYFYPKDGFKMLGHSIIFPTLEEVLKDNRDSIPELDLEDKESRKIPEPTIFNRRKREALIAEIAKEDSLKQKRIEEQIDTIENIRSTLSDAGYFYLPNNDVSYFDNFFARAAEAKLRGEVLRVLHYGDSQIEMDRMSGNLRVFFQSHFGGGGPGLVPVVQTVASYAVLQSASGTFTLYSSYGDGARARGNYGHMLKCHRLTGRGTFIANASSSKRTDGRVKKFSQITMLYNDHDGNFSATLIDKKNGYDSTFASKGKGIQSMRWDMDSSTTSIKINMQGVADIYGIMIDNGPGVSVDNIPLRSSSGNQFTLVTDSILRKCYKLSNVGMVIMQFGGNSVPAIYNLKSINDYCAQMQLQIEKIRSTCPNATILFIGPSDMSTSYKGSMQTYRLLPELVSNLKDMCNRNNVAYWDLYEMMGGKNSMVAWVQKGWAGPDYIHFTPAGAQYAGKQLSDNFAMMYEVYKTRRRMGSEQFDSLWEATER